MVPKGWKHPTTNGSFDPRFEGSFMEALDYWAKTPGSHYPVKEHYSTVHVPRKPRNCFQVYENCTEGTPISPVFETETALIEWLMKDGRGMGIGGGRLRLTQKQAEAFVGAKYAPSFTVTSRGVSEGVRHLPQTRRKSKRES